MRATDVNGVGETPCSTPQWDGAVRLFRLRRPASGSPSACQQRARRRVSCILGAVLVWKLDRLGRSLVHLVKLMEEFRRVGIELVSFSEGLDFTTTTGKLLFQIISAFAEFERDCIRERVMAGLRNARAKGNRIGRPRKHIDIPLLASLRREGHSWRKLADKLGVGASTARRAFHRFAGDSAEALAI